MNYLSSRLQPTLPVPLPPKAPAGFHLLAKPTGAACNLGCKYCFYLPKERLYPGSRWRMTDELLELYIKQLLESHRAPRVTVAWQGGEPTLMGTDFYRKAIEYQEKYRRPGMTFENTIQTNGTLLDDEWCEFFKENRFLIGISIDRPRDLHDIYVDPVHPGSRAHEPGRLHPDPDRGSGFAAIGAAQAVWALSHPGL